MGDDRRAESGRTRLARGTKPHALSGMTGMTGMTGQRELAGDAGPSVATGPVPADGAPGSAGRAPAQSIHEAVEQLIEAKEADEAIAEWMQGGG